MYLNCGQKLFKCYIYFHNIGDRSATEIEINLLLATKSVHFYYTPVYYAFIKNIFNKDLCKNVHDKEIQIALSKWEVL